MAAFRIHEDIENISPNFVSTKYIKFEEKKYEKKNFLDNRGKCQPLNVIVQEAKKEKFITKSSKIPVPNNNYTTLEEKEDLNCKTVQECLFEIEKENNVLQSQIEEGEKEYFPPCLWQNDEYRKEIWQYLRDLEEIYPRPKQNYMLKQTDLTWGARTILIDWLVSVSEEYHFCHETFHLSVNYIDRFLSEISVVRRKFQLLGAAAMMLASKMEEYYPLDAKEWAYLTDNSYSRKQILKMEQIIMKILRFKLQTPTIYGFIQHLSTEYTMDVKTVHLAMYISELVLLEAKDYLSILPSKLAASAIALARFLSKTDPWPQQLIHASGYSLKELHPVVRKQFKTLKDSPRKKEQAIRNKYESSKYSKVAQCTILDLDDISKI